MYLIRKIGNVALADIGREFSNRDHSTVIHAINQVEQRISEDTAFAETVKDITANINARH